MNYRGALPFFKDAVKASPELDRVMELPRRPPVDLSPGSVRAEALVELMSSRLRRPDRPPGSPCGCISLGRRRCIDRLLPAQAWALFEAPLAGGLFGALGVGSGKTLLNILMAMVMPNTKVVALLVPPGLVKQLEGEYKAIREHFLVPSLLLPDGTGHLVPGAPVVHVIPYSRFSRPEATDLLDRLAPDLLLADECHKIKSRSAARTIRVLRRFVAAPNTRMCDWSGTPFKRSIKDSAHLMAFALCEGSPLPLDPDVVEQWAAAVDPSDWPAPAGALKKLCNPGEKIREALARRIFETRGVVSTRSSSNVGASLPMRERVPPKMPSNLSDMIGDVRNSWLRPDGEELVDALSVSQCARQLVCGFFYRWRFPGNPKAEDVERWFAARKAWGREMREKLKSPQPHLDSPRLLANAAERSCLNNYSGDLPVWHAASWPAWRDIKNTIKHETVPVWVDNYLVNDAVAWARETKGIVWYEYRAFGEAVSKASGLPLHAGGPNAEARILAEKGDRSIIVSLSSSHSEGRDGLQYRFNEQLVTNPPASGDEWEQLLGRLHRQGQESDEVVTYVYRHVPDMREDLDKAIVLAKFVQGLTTANQKLLTCDVEWELRGHLPFVPVERPAGVGAAV